MRAVRRGPQFEISYQEVIAVVPPRIMQWILACTNLLIGFNAEDPDFVVIQSNLRAYRRPAIGDVAALFLPLRIDDDENCTLQYVALGQ